ncbi:hypothetical protein [Streptosporangium longisporum]|uniref:DUF624 domain-containing protein n=1 Tax=Streptosporangium longisporum TaxID=46187 RepID=A0ABP6L9S3_9ACTN
MRGGRLELLAESLVLGLLMFLASLPVVTAFVALAAGCALLRDREEVSVGVRPYWARLRQVARSGPAGFLAPAAVAGALLLDGVAVRAGVPGHQVLSYLVPALAVVAGALALRVAVAWRPGTSWPDAARTAADHLAGDRYGTALLAAAVPVAAIICLGYPVVTPLVLGQLALAAVAVDARRVRHA